MDSIIATAKALHATLQKLNPSNPDAISDDLQTMLAVKQQKAKLTNLRDVINSIFLIFT